jgi:N-acetylmuramic acid 6-phosphate etherase
MTITGLSYEESETCLHKAEGHVKTALVMIKANTDYDTAVKLLQRSDGFVRKAIELNSKQ